MEKTVQSPQNASNYLEKAAKYYKQAAKYHKEGNHEKAKFNMLKAQDCTKLASES